MNYFHAAKLVTRIQRRGTVGMLYHLLRKKKLKNNCRVGITFLIKSMFGFMAWGSASRSVRLRTAKEPETGNGDVIPTSDVIPTVASFGIF